MYTCPAAMCVYINQQLSQTCLPQVPSYSWYLGEQEPLREFNELVRTLKMR